MLDFLNRDLGSTNPLAKLSSSELRKLEESLLTQMDATSLVSAGDRLSFVATQEAVRPILDQLVAVRQELSTRKVRWRYERKGFWLVVVIYGFASLCFAIWLLDWFFKTSRHGP